MSTLPYQYICIEGNIGAGKTTLTQMLSRKWDAYPIFEQFTDNPFLPKFYENQERYAFQVELFFMTERYKQMEQLNIHADLFDQLFIADYFFYKTLLFASKTLYEDEFRLFKRLFDVMAKSTPQPDLLVYLHRHVDILHHQINKRGRRMESAIQLDYLIQVQDAYLEYFRNVTHFPILIIEAHELDFEYNPKDFSLIQDVISQHYRPGVHRLSF